MIKPSVTPLLKVDAEGVPLLVQHIRYIFSSYYLELTFFDGRKVQCEPGWLLRYEPEISDKQLTPEQLYDAYKSAQGEQGAFIGGYTT